MPRWILCLLLALMWSCGSAQFQSESLAGFELADYRTWSWKPRDPGVTRSARFADDSPLGEAVRAVVAEQLTAAGLERVSPNDADLLVTWDVEVFRHVKTYNQIRDAQGLAGAQAGGNTYGLGGGSAGNATVTRAYKTATLTIELYDRDRVDKVWLGWAETAVGSETTLEEALVIVDACSRGIMARLPDH